MSRTKKIKLSTALVVIPEPVKPVKVTKEQVKAWKVFRIYCTASKASYFGICLSYKTVTGLLSAYSYGARNGHTNLAVSSIRQYGLENHILTFVSANFSDRAEALAEKGRTILRFSRNRPLLNQNAQTECEIVLSERTTGKIIIEPWSRGFQDTDGE